MERLLFSAADPAMAAATASPAVICLSIAAAHGCKWAKRDF